MSRFNHWYPLQLVVATLIFIMALSFSDLPPPQDRNSISSRPNWLGHRFPSVLGAQAWGDDDDDNDEEDDHNHDHRHDTGSGYEEGSMFKQMSQL